MELIHDDRRNNRRYDLTMELRYKLVARGQAGLNGTGKTYNISSGGVLFETDQLLPVGSFVEVAIHWPVLLQETCPLTLLVVGRIVRADGRGAAVRTTRYEFLTRARRPAQQPASEPKRHTYTV